MSKSERDRREAEKAARRAQRLAQRADQRAQRKEDQAARAAERAERLAERARRRPGRDRDRETSIEDLVDEMTEKGMRKAGAWLDEKTEGLRDLSEEGSSRVDREFARAERKARQARRDAERLKAEAEDQVNDLHDEDEDDLYEDEAPRRRKSSRRRNRGNYRYDYSFDSGFDKWFGHGWGGRVRARRRGRGAGSNLYRDSKKGKVCGVCAGVADYFGVRAWKLRFAAVMGLIFIPQIMVPAYFLTYFLMDDKPYYRRVTDRFEDLRTDHMSKEQRKADRSAQSERTANEGRSRLSSVQAMRLAKEKFSDIEERLRAMETHVTSSRFELQREFRKISGDEVS